MYMYVYVNVCMCVCVKPPLLKLIEYVWLIRKFVRAWYVPSQYFKCELSFIVKGFLVIDCDGS